MNYDVLIIGGGIIGLACAREVGLRYPGLSIGLLEKEDELARHQTGRNSGVIHAGVYYQPGSLKARFCRDGVDATIEFCRTHDIRFEQCGKMIVATKSDDLNRMNALYDRAISNGVAIERLDGRELSRREPHIQGLGSLFVSTTGIVDYAQITRAMATETETRGAQIHKGQEVVTIREEASLVTVETTRQTFTASNIIVCAGIMADRVAEMSGLELDFQMVPFRGEYYRLAARHNEIVNHLIYPVPDPELPFLGVHLTRMIGGYVTVGPNAVLAFSRNGYRFGDISPRDLYETVSYPGFRKMAKRYLSSGLSEMWNSLSKRRYLALCQRYCPELKLEDLEPYRAGVRAQAIMRDGTLVHDFIFRQTSRSIHVCNAPSPAATSAMPIAREVIDRASAQFAW
jgi:L-2-hydroxyglutarate oxidase